MEYVMINTLDGLPVCVFEMRLTDIDQIDWIDACHCVNQLAHLQIRGRHIIFMNKERHEFASLACQDHAEACKVALSDFGYMCDFDDSIVDEGASS